MSPHPFAPTGACAPPCCAHVPPSPHHQSILDSILALTTNLKHPSPYVTASPPSAFLGFNTFYKIRDARGAAYERAGLLEDEPPRHSAHSNTYTAQAAHCGAGVSATAVSAGGAVPLSTFASHTAGAAHAHGTSCQV